MCIAQTCVIADCRTDGECQAGQECVDHQCRDLLICTEDADCDATRPVCDTDAGKCVTCVAQCTGLCCGDDGCGGQCPDRCADTGQSCNSDTCQCEGECQPDCAGKECGPDGCDDTCAPGCADNEYCDSEGLCACAPDCAGKECGPNGCGGECSPGCADTEVCDATGQCSACESECGTRECGLDPTCGISCGKCTNNESCNLAGVCGPWCEVGETRCDEDGFGFEVCGYQADIDQNTFGWRIPCMPGDACLMASGQCKREACLQTEVMFLLDRSSSMLSANSWDWVVEGLLRQVYRNESVNAFGIRQFPSDTACSVGSVLPMENYNYSSIDNYITDPSAASATPIEDALAGFAGEYGDPNDGQAVVLISDGDETCGTQQGAIEAASSLWRAGIRVYVIAVTTSANKIFLDQLAFAGGSVESSRVTQLSDYQAALAAIFTDLDACECKDGGWLCLDDHALNCNAEGAWVDTPCIHPDACIFGECVCQPQCQDKQCGDDACGDVCGICTGQDLCQNDQCVCQPDCDGKECGPDGCGDQCAACPDGQSCLNGLCQDSLFADDFEDNDFSDWTTDAGDYLRELVSPGADGSSYCLTLDGGHSIRYDGVTRHLPDLTPSLIRFWVRSSETTNDAGQFVVGNENDPAALAYFFLENIGKVTLTDHIGGDWGNFVYAANTWVLVEFRNIDWSNHNFDLYINGNLDDSNVPFRDQSASHVNQLSLFNYHSAAVAWWDEIVWE